MESSLHPCASVARWLLIIVVGLVGLESRAGAVTIHIDEFTNDSVVLPFAPQQGTLSLCEDSILLIITCEGLVSDSVVFLADATTGMGVALLESDLSESGTPDAPGDRMLLIPFPEPFFAIGEPGAEETTQTVLYTPTVGQPGFALEDGVPVSYEITSDEVPEPATWLLITTGLAALVDFVRIQRTTGALVAKNASGAKTHVPTSIASRSREPER